MRVGASGTCLSEKMKKQVLDAVITCSKNIASDPSDLERRQVKLCDAYFLKWSSAALALFCTGPAAFSLVPTSIVETTKESITGDRTDIFLISKLRLYHEGGDIGRRGVATAMHSYTKFIEEFGVICQYI